MLNSHSPAPMAPDILVAPDGTEIDVCEQTDRLSATGRYYRKGNAMTGGSARFCYRFGWRLIVIVGLPTAIGLVDDMVSQQEISPDFGDYLRDLWTDADAKIRAAQE